MKRILLLIAFAFSSNMAICQIMYDYKTKTKSNENDRTMMLDILRADLYQEYKQEFIFVVDVLNVSNGYAWFKGIVQRKDGRKVISGQDTDCCHVESLFKKSNGKWYIVESAAFGTDVWYDGIWNRTNAPKKIFGRDYHN